MDTVIYGQIKSNKFYSSKNHVHFIWQNEIFNYETYGFIPYECNNTTDRQLFTLFTHLWTNRRLTWKYEYTVSANEAKSIAAPAEEIHMDR